jgi:hypothetical protein
VFTVLKISIAFACKSAILKLQLPNATISSSLKIHRRISKQAYPIIVIIIFIPFHALQWNSQLFFPSQTYRYIEFSISSSFPQHFNMSAWPQQRLDHFEDTANYSCVSSNNSVGLGVRSVTWFGVECKREEELLDYYSILKFKCFLFVSLQIHQKMLRLRRARCK